jgi:hypothetical protein
MSSSTLELGPLNPGLRSETGGTQQVKNYS